ncbi:MAG: rod shape-determining protein [Candidatus Schekmanbacteria bacterium]|nr:MAG: rod shape-determining protein [Candidatus Schekmanbacteria bacterium]
MSLFPFFSKDIAIDLGTANTLIFLKSKGIIIDEPSVIALDKKTMKPVAYGKEAKKMLGKSPSSIEVIRPIRDGVISNLEATLLLLEYFIQKVYNRKFFINPRVVISIPLGITSVERRALKESVEEAGASEVYIIEQPMAAAIGAGLAVQEPAGNMIVDIGGGTTEVAVIALAGIVSGDSLRIAGDEIDTAIINFVKNKYNILIGEQMAERAKIKICSAVNRENNNEMEIKGRDLTEGLPATVLVKREEIKEAIRETLSIIVNSVLQTLENTPPELAADIVDKGIYLAGGGALLDGIHELMNEETGLPVYTAENPLSAVALGAGKVLDEIDLLKEISL